MAQSSVGAGLGFITTVSTRVVQRLKDRRCLEVLDDVTEDQLIYESNRFADSLIRQVTGNVTSDGWYHITSDFGSAAEAIQACKCPLSFAFADMLAHQIPMICQPVDCRVKPVPLSRGMTAAEVYGTYTKMADPNKLFSFGMTVPDFQLDRLVFTLWKHNRTLWGADLGELDGKRMVGAHPYPRDKYYEEGECILICE